MKRLLSLCLALILALGIVTVVLPTEPAQAQSLPVHNIDTGLHYATIQEAIDAFETIHGHIIQVNAGVYYENVALTKSLVLKGENMPVVDAEGTGNAITVFADCCTIDGFIITGSGIGDSWGVLNDSHNNVTINNCKINNFGSGGIYLGHCSNSMVVNNLLYNNYDGIKTWESNYNTLINNNITNNSGIGIALFNTNNSNVENNSVYNNEMIGILLSSGSSNNLTNNTVTGNTNTGIHVSESNDNHIYHNIVKENAVNAYDRNGGSSWDNGYPSGGNYWSDYDGVDLYSGPNQDQPGSDGIGDTPYTFSHCQDRYPFVANFSNITDEVGLTGISGFRISIADVNGDHYPDLLLHQIPENSPPGCITCKEQALYLNVQGDDPNNPYSRKFIDYTAESGIRASRRGTDDRRSNLAVFADVDNDGDLDLFTGLYAHGLENYNDNGDRNDLLLNDGSGHFTLAQNSPFHNENLWNTSSATFLDYDRDGNIDLFVGNYYRYGALTLDRLYHGHGDGSFTDVTSTTGIGTTSTCVYAVAAFDWNNDGFMDLFAPSYSNSVLGSTPVHWKNNGDNTFSKAQGTNYDQDRGYGSDMSSFGTMPRDFDNDGDIDFLEIITHGWGDGTTGIHSTVVVNENDIYSWDYCRVNGRADDDPHLEHHGDHYGSWFDIDNDGLDDLVLTENGYNNNRLYIFKQLVDNTFSLVTSEVGLKPVNDSGLPVHNASPLDYDLDGDEDLLIGFGSTDGIQLWRNNVGTDNNWITITLEGAGVPGYSNRSAIGSRVKITAGCKTFTREVYAGNGQFGPQVPLSLTFGLGAATQVDSIKVYWPNNNCTSTELSNIDINHFIVIKEALPPTVGPVDTPRPIPVEYKKTRYDYLPSKSNFQKLRAWLKVRIENRGEADAFNVTATITQMPANVSIALPPDVIPGGGDVTVGDIPAGGSAWSEDVFIIEVDWDSPVDPCEGIFWRIEYDDAAGIHHVIENVPEFPPGEGPCD